jgi:hypothetical protein
LFGGSTLNKSRTSLGWQEDILMQYKITLLIIMLSFVFASCSPGDAEIATAISKTQVESESNKPTPRPIATITPTVSNDICYWFLITQSLRTRRLSGLNELTEWLQTHDFNSLDEVGAMEFVEILVNYQPYQEEFVLDWKELGPHPDAVLFWEKELESVELKIEGIDEMEKGLENNDSSLFGHGLELFFGSQQPGHEAESAMLEVRSKCID